MGSALSTFNDLNNGTGPSYLTSAESIVNDVEKNSYLLRRFLRGKGMDKTVQGGKTIKDDIMLDDQSTAQFYQPNETFSWQNPQVLTEWEVNWRFLADHKAWTDPEVELQIGENLTRTGRFQVYKKLKYSKEQRMWTSMLNKMEVQLFAEPEQAKHEAAAGTEPAPLPMFINEHTNTLWGSGITGAADALTSVQGIDPSVESGWQNQLETYSSSAANPPGTGAPTVDNLLAASDAMFYKVQFQSPGTREQYFEDPSLFSQFIACSRFGINTYQQILRASQDTFVTQSRQDPAYVSPTYGGIDFIYVAELDTAALYTDGTNLVAEQGASATNDGPRYYWINGKYLCPVFHSRRYLMMHQTMRHPNQPFTTIQPVDCWYNVVCRSRRRQGLVGPTGDIY